ncbi:T6SS amidase immunity protein Tai4 family protein [Pseudescherichia sp.]|uniref:T6SS amidase immunity protein Tai4 family protein n=1 Tax=Pseudescherichia sp. TaxID=2055881 RepID=UPI00289697E9|nr:T6SS amidase immunity protein Tai4 family protein [Pseudescherichia sp.]
MKILLTFLLVITSSVVCAQTLPEVNSFSQQQIFSNWVQNRCIGKIADSESLKNDAKVSASAWLEASNLSAELFEEAEKNIDNQLVERIGGSLPGEYQVLKCTLIANSNAINKIYDKGIK